MSDELDWVSKLNWAWVGDPAKCPWFMNSRLPWLIYRDEDYE